MVFGVVAAFTTVTTALTLLRLARRQALKGTPMAGHRPAAMVFVSACAFMTLAVRKLVSPVAIGQDWVASTLFSVGAATFSLFAFTFVWTWIRVVAASAVRTTRLATALRIMQRVFTATAVANTLSVLLVLFIITANAHQLVQVEC